jgi:hypothetical protein
MAQPPGSSSARQAGWGEARLGGTGRCGWLELPAFLALWQFVSPRNAVCVYVCVVMGDWTLMALVAFLPEMTTQSNPGHA